MKRKIYDELVKWKENEINKPILVLGIRQCGKPYIIEEFCKNEYDIYIKVNLF